MFCLTFLMRITSVKSPKSKQKRRKTLKRSILKKSNKTVKVFINLSFVYLLSIFIKQCFII